MKGLLALLCLLTLPLFAASETATVTVPNADAPALGTLLEAWIQKRVNDDGSLIYPGATIGARRTALLDTLLRDALREKILSACLQFPGNCPESIQLAIEEKSAAGTMVTTEIAALIQ